jgi:hypothetical protein
MTAIFLQHPIKLTYPFLSMLSCNWHLVHCLSDYIGIGILSDAVPAVVRAGGGAAGGDSLRAEQELGPYFKLHFSHWLARAWN